MFAQLLPRAPVLKPRWPGGGLAANVGWDRCERKDPRPRRQTLSALTGFQTLPSAASQLRWPPPEKEKVAHLLSHSSGSDFSAPCPLCPSVARTPAGSYSHAGLADKRGRCDGAGRGARGDSALESCWLGNRRAGLQGKGPLLSAA